MWSGYMDIEVDWKLAEMPGSNACLKSVQWSPVTRGVRQVSVLGLILFNSLVTELDSGAKCKWSSANDVKLEGAGDTPYRCVMIQRDLKGWRNGWVTMTLCEEPFPNVQSELSLMQLHSIYSCPIIDHQRGEISNLPSVYTLEEIADCDEVIPQPSILQTKLQKWLQPHLVSLALKTIHRLVSLLWTHSCNFIGFPHWSTWNYPE